MTGIGPERLRTLVACVAVAGVATVLSTGLPGLPELLWSASDVPTPGPDRSSTEADEDGSVRLHVQLPTQLRPGAMAPVRVSSDPSSALRPDDLVELRLHAEPAVGLRGRIWIDPPQRIVRVDELHRVRFSLGVLPTVACERAPGELRVELRALHRGGEAAERTRPLPPVTCDSSGPPPAPASVHLDTPVCGDDWRRDVDMLIAGETPPPAPCRAAPPAASGGGPANDDASHEPEEAEDGEESEEAAEGDDEPDHTRRDEPTDDDPRDDEQEDRRDDDRDGEDDPRGEDDPDDDDRDDEDREDDDRDDDDREDEERER